jgi:hypothetical protein
MKVNTFIFRFVLLFTLGFVLTLTFPFYILPDLGGIISDIFIPINDFWGKLIGLRVNGPFYIVSDSTGLYLHLITLTVISIFSSLIWSLFFKTNSFKLQYWFHTSVAYYLALILFKYGFDKVFKHQFYFPEPNTLFTPLGQLSPDILFWSSMGTSYSYSIFSGLIELLPAALLLFKKTRLLGGIIATAVLTNVVMINFGFNISVKLYSVFLFFLSLIIITPNFKNLVLFFTTNKVASQKIQEVTYSSKMQLLIYALAKALVISILLLESLGGFFAIQNFNDDNFPKPYLHGAYSVENNQETTNDIKRVFFHRKQYFITQSEDDQFRSYKLKFSENTSELILIDELEKSNKLSYLYDDEIMVLFLSGMLNGKKIKLKLNKENLTDLPILKKSI